MRRAKGGEVEFRAQKTGVVHSSIGRANFAHDKLRENALAWLCAPTRSPASRVASLARSLARLRVRCRTCASRPSDLTTRTRPCDRVMRRDGVLKLRPERYRNKSPKSIHLQTDYGPGVRLDHTMW